ncbi:MAG: nicotinate-nucleotide--dimethylbenzimidazole phosphoribosyltransferase [Selenomonadaceae bacterium]|nr:nicotinate-nucleotide--dimethylbenzimidazole phosphoribosyltransferase [Selenomonadaceae bacterium]
MTLLEETIRQIVPPDRQISAEVEKQLFQSFPNAGTLGALKELLLQYTGIVGNAAPELPKKCTIICCADHGVAEAGVSAYPPETTVEMTANYLISRGGTANAFSNFAGSDLLVIDMGIAADTSDIPGLVDRKIAYGTQNCAKGPAMTREQALQSIETGIRIAASCAENGYTCFLPGEMGIANTTSSAAICSVLCGISPEQATGRGTNISDERLRHKISVVKQAIEVNAPDPSDGIDVLAKVGGFELGCIAGLILGAAAHHAAVILDGFNTGAAALIAMAIAPESRGYLIGSHLAAEEGHQAVLKRLGIVPYMHLQLRLGEAAGSSLAANLLDAAIRLYQTLAAESDKSPLALFDEEVMDDVAPKITDKTFNFYLNTMPTLGRSFMEKCQTRIDHLAKPLYSLGSLEQIMVQLAGILDEERPRQNTPRVMLCFAPADPEAVAAAEAKAENEDESLMDRTDDTIDLEEDISGQFAGRLSDADLRVMQSFAVHADAEGFMAYLRDKFPPTAAFNFGRMIAEDITFTTPLLAVTCMTPKDAPLSVSEELKAALLDENGNLKYAAEDFLTHVPKHLQGMVSALTGAMIAGSHNSSLIVLDNPATEIIARYTEQLCPAIRPYILHTQPMLLQLGMTTDGGGIACLGLCIIDAALHMLNDMKTFEETSVSIAADGPGAKKQQL